MSEVKHITVNSTFEEPIAPTHIRSTFKSIQEWLINICEGKRPKTTISEFNIRLSFRQPSNEFIVCLYGVNTRLDENGQFYTFIDFEPSSMYFKFSKKQYKEFTYLRMKEELTVILRDFTQSEKFKSSFFSKSNIRTNYNGELIWSIE